MSRLRKSLNSLISLYIADFEEKHEVELEYWVAEDTIGIAAFGDHFFNLSDIIFDVDNEIQPRAIFWWQDYCIDCHNAGLHSVNFKSYLAGARCDKSDLYLEIQNEVNRAKTLHENKDYTPVDWLAVLMAEVGEVAHEVDTAKESGKPLKPNYRTELIHVAAVAIRAVQNYDRGKNDNS